MKMSEEERETGRKNAAKTR
jgi:hypothetical protein